MELEISMTDQETGTSSTRSDMMARAWAKRKANASAEAAWFQKPICLCGCGEALVRHRNSEKQRLFRPGHDQRLKSAVCWCAGRRGAKACYPQRREGAEEPHRF